MKRIAIACQGGGSHCAFTGGVLTALLRQVRVDDSSRERPLLIRVGGQDCQIVGLSGTSGGAISAYLGWVDLLRLRSGQTRGETLAVARFWDGVAAQFFALPPSDLLSNLVQVSLASLEGVLPLLASTPNAFTTIVQRRLKESIEAAAGDLSFLAPHGDSDDAGLSRTQIKGLQCSPDDFPVLLIGAANVNAGVFAPFVGTPRHPPSVDQVVASTALPDLYPSVAIATPTPADAPGPGSPHQTAYYWDGLLSQNPPLGDFLAFDDCAAKPDEIWIVRINPVARTDAQGVPLQVPPRHASEILDRRNELAGNLSLEQEKRFIRRINAMRRRGHLSDSGRNEYKHVALWGISLDGLPDMPEDEAHPDGWQRRSGVRLGRDLDYATKLQRDPAFLKELTTLGQAALEEFLTYREPPPPRGAGCAR